MDPLTLLLLAAVTYGVTRKEPLPILGDLLAGGQRAPEQRRAASLPVVSHSEIAMVSYLKDGARYFSKPICASLWDLLQRYTVEPIVERPGVPPGMFKLVPRTGAHEMPATELVDSAASKGFYALVSIASAFHNYAASDKILLLTDDAKVANVRTQFAILGPLPSFKEAKKIVASSASSTATDFDAELEVAQKEGLNPELVRSALEKPDANPDALDAIAKGLSNYPRIAAKIASRAATLRARDALKGVVGGSPASSKQKNGAHEAFPKPADVIDVEVIEEKPVA